MKKKIISIVMIIAIVAVCLCAFAGCNKKNDKVLVVATNLDFQPFEYVNGTEAVGIDMEIAKLLADYLGMELKVVNMDFDAVVTAVQTNDEYDVGIAGLTITEERKEVVSFSNAYFGATQIVITKENDTTFNGCTTAEQVENVISGLTGNAAKCGGQTGTTSQFYINGNEDLGFDGFSNITFTPYSSAALAIQDMLNGNIAFVVVDKAVGQSLVNSVNSSETKIALVNVDLSSEEYAFAVKKSNTELLAKINAFFDANKDNINTIMDKYLNANADQLASYKTGISFENR